MSTGGSDFQLPIVILIFLFVIANPGLKELGQLKLHAFGVIIDRGQENALLTLKETWGNFGGSSSWIAGADCTQWANIQCDSYGNVVFLVIGYAENPKATGFIPDIIGELRYLETFFLIGNRFHGSIPASIGNLTRLVDLILSNNGLQGSIPETMGNLKGLINLELQGNRIVGNFPSVLTKLSLLERLALSDNNLEGPLPATFDQATWPVMNMLDLAGNKFSGEIPAALGRLTSILRLYLNNNIFTGGFPLGLSLLTALRTLNIGSNRLSGPIPRDGLLPLRFLFQLSIANNKFSGATPWLPTSAFRFLESVQIQGNRFSILRPSLPSRSLTSFLAGDNKFSGKLPISMFQGCTRLSELSLAGNNFTGGLPPAIGSIKLLTLLDISRNPKLGGILPSTLGELQGLSDIYLQGCGLTGIIPDDIFRTLTNLVRLDLSYNLLSGSLPASIAQTATLTSIKLQHNRLGGEIAAGTFNNFRSGRILLYRNAFKGPLPSFPNAAAKDLYININSNFFSGQPYFRLSSEAQICPYEGRATRLTKAFHVAKNCLTSTPSCRVRQQRQSKVCERYS